MKCTEKHVIYFMQRKGGEWAKAALARRQVSVHELIPDTRKNQFTLDNTLAILRGARKRGGADEMRSQLGLMAVSPGCTNSKRRAGYCRLWHSRMKRTPKPA